LPRTATKYLESSVLDDLSYLACGLGFCHQLGCHFSDVLRRQVRQLFEDSACLILNRIVEWTMR
jgi:hypothetical protein